MATVRYVGPFADGVDLRVGGRWRTVRPGEALEVPDDLAASLLEQAENWEAVKPPKGARAQAGRE